MKKDFPTDLVLSFVTGKVIGEFATKDMLTLIASVSGDAFTCLDVGSYDKSKAEAKKLFSQNHPELNSIKLPKEAKTPEQILQWRKDIYKKYKLKETFSVIIKQDLSILIPLNQLNFGPPN